MKVYTTTEIYKRANETINELVLTAHQDSKILQERYNINEELSNKIIAIILNSAFRKFTEGINSEKLNKN